MTEAYNPFDDSRITVALAAEAGRTLEELIHAATLKIPGLTRSLRENDIRSHFGEASLNGVDHWINLGDRHILLQDKWKETTSQPEVAQFLTCAERIKSRLPVTDSVYLMWVSKQEPTLNSRRMLEEHSSEMVCCSVSLEALARCAVLQICECLEVDCIEPLRAIVSDKRYTPMRSTGREIAASAPPIATLSYDNIEEGKQEQLKVRTLLTSVHQIINRISAAISLEGSWDIRTLWDAAAPKNIEDWLNGKWDKVDFTAFLKAVKAISCPTAKKHFQSRTMYLYVKLRKASVELATHATTYESLRKNMITKKSVWVKSIASFKAVAEPITEAEFKGMATHCEDYWDNRMNSITKKIEKVPAIHIESAFWTAQCMLN